MPLPDPHAGHTSDVHLDTATDRVTAGQSAGDTYVKSLESIRDDLDNPNKHGTTLGTMVSSQLQMTEAETKYMVQAGLPKKVSTVVQQIAGEVKKGGG